MRALVATALAMALLGEAASAHATTQSINASGSAQGIYVGSTLALLGETDRALDAIEDLFDHGWGDMHWLEVDPAFGWLSGHRRFRGAASRMSGRLGRISGEFQISFRC